MKAQAKKVSQKQTEEAQNSPLQVANKSARGEKKSRKQDKEARNSTLRGGKEACEGRKIEGASQECKPKAGQGNLKFIPAGGQ